MSRVRPNYNESINEIFMNEYSSSEKKGLENAMESDARKQSAKQAEEEQKQLNQDKTEEQGNTNVEMGSGEQVRVSSYAGPFIAAGFKDLMDFSLLTSIWGIGTLLTINVSTLIVFLLIFPKTKYKIGSNGRLLIIDACILMGLIPIEGFAFPLNLLPFTVGAVVMIYKFDKKFIASRNDGTLKSKKKELTSVIRKALKR